MVGEAGTGLNAPAANSLRYATRQPDTDPQTLSLYGQSYSRSLLLAVGPFPPGLRVAEDSALNRQVARRVTPVWAPEVQTRYRDVATLQDWVRDERLRDLRRATHALYRPLATTETPAEGVANLLVLRLGFAKALQACDGSLTDAKCHALAASQWLALQADRHGVMTGFATIPRQRRWPAKRLGQAIPPWRERPQRLTRKTRQTGIGLAIWSAGRATCQTQPQPTAPPLACVPTIFPHQSRLLPW